MKTLIMTVGLPRSGKSTWAKTYAEKHGTPIVCPDSIRLAMHGKPFIGSMEPYVWAVAKTMVKALFLSGHETVILDATNITVERREQWKSRDWVRQYEEFDTTQEVCNRRCDELESDIHRDSLRIAVVRMSEEREPISPDEQRDEEDNARI